jgi:hypothetical protein
MRLAHLLHNTFELFVGSEKVLVHLIHLLCQLHDLIVRLLDQLTSHLQALLPTLYSSQDLLDLTIDLLIHLLPLLHLRQLHLSSILRSVLIANYPVIVLFARLEKLLSHLSVGLLLATTEQLSVEVGRGVK